MYKVRSVMQQQVYECHMNSITEQKQRFINCCRMTYCELFRWLVETLPRDVEHYHMFTASRSPGVTL